MRVAAEVRGRHSPIRGGVLALVERLVPSRLVTPVGVEQTAHQGQRRVVERGHRLALIVQHEDHQLDQTAVRRRRGSWLTASMVG